MNGVEKKFTDSIEGVQKIKKATSSTRKKAIDFKKEGNEDF